MKELTEERKAELEKAAYHLKKAKQYGKWLVAMLILWMLFYLCIK